MSNIEWTDETWNPVVGCTPVSPGCLNCYAATMARRLEAMGRPEYAPRTPTVDEIADRHQRGKHWQSLENPIRIAEVRGGRAVFTGEVRTLEDRLTEPLTWRKPRRVFVNSMSDLFHEAVPFEFIVKVFGIICRCGPSSWAKDDPIGSCFGGHTFQILTKRPERMAAITNDPAFWEAVWRECGCDYSRTFPLPHIWLGTSVENQATADERIPHLLKCPAAVRFLSCEPLLGPVDLTPWLTEADPHDMDREVASIIADLRAGQGGVKSCVVRDAIHWVIVGGESGPMARPCDLACVPSGRRTCACVSCRVAALENNHEQDRRTN
jgi:protein gp37